MVEESEEIWMGGWEDGRVGGGDLVLGDFSEGAAEGVGSSKCFLTRVSMSSREKWDLRR